MQSTDRQAPGAAPSPFVLVVDDESGVRDLMSRWLQAGGFDVASAAGAEEALGLMQQEPPAVALCDIRMPGRDGLWLADRIRHEYPETAVIMATGVHDVGPAVASLRRGVVDYLTKPFGRDRLRDAVVRAVEWHRSARDARGWRDRMEDDLRVRRDRLAATVAAIDVASDEALDRVLCLATAGDPEACAHGQRVAALAVSIAHAAGLPPDAVTPVRHAALLHDLGKQALPDALLRKPAPLTREEAAIVRRHPAIAADVLATHPYLAAAAALVRAVPERPDGLGYPDGLAGASIPSGARFVAAADAYDTMIRPRVFRGAVTAVEALAELERCSGTQFDPEVVRILKRLVTH